ncbi:hypothetical protein N8835_02870 [Alphaproteobacteria bacterium]|nr:hypothetical protein [Alphaproteobacteria bacterium]
MIDINVLDAAPGEGDLLKAGASYFAERLFTKAQRKKLTVMIDVTGQPIRVPITRDMLLGKKGLLSTSPPILFELTVSTAAGIRDAMEVVAHELIHVSQSHNGRLVVTKKKRKIQGEKRLVHIGKWLNTKAQPIEEIQWQQRPWEIEACHWQKILVDEFVGRSMGGNIVPLVQKPKKKQLALYKVAPALLAPAGMSSRAVPQQLPQTAPPAPVQVPIEAPTQAPIQAPVQAPVQQQVQQPVQPPVQQPIPAPIPAPVQAPIQAPVETVPPVMSAPPVPPPTQQVAPTVTPDTPVMMPPPVGSFGAPTSPAPPTPPADPVIAPQLPNEPVAEAPAVLEPALDDAALIAGLGDLDAPDGLDAASEPASDPAPISAPEPIATQEPVAETIPELTPPPAPAPTPAPAPAVLDEAALARLAAVGDLDPAIMVEVPGLDEPRFLSPTSVDGKVDELLKRGLISAEDAAAARSGELS